MTHDAQDKPLLNGGENGFEHGRLETTTAGRFLIPDWSVNGKGTSTMAPKRNLVVTAMVQIRS